MHLRNSLKLLNVKIQQKVVSIFLDDPSLAYHVVFKIP